MTGVATEKPYSSERSMGNVIALRRRSPAKLPETELALLTSLNSSLAVLERGGWATPGEARGVILRQQGRALGHWCFADGTYRYLSIRDARTIIVALTLHEAHASTLRILGPRQHADSHAVTRPSP